MVVVLVFVLVDLVVLDVVVVVVKATVVVVTIVEADDVVIVLVMGAVVVLVNIVVYFSSLDIHQPGRVLEYSERSLDYRYSALREACYLRHAGPLSLIRSNIPTHTHTHH